jgi:hypothetical protein
MSHQVVIEKKQIQVMDMMLCKMGCITNDVISPGVCPKMVVSEMENNQIIQDWQFFNRETNGEGVAHLMNLPHYARPLRLILSQQNMKTGRVPAGHAPHIRSCLKNEGE